MPNLTANYNFKKPLETERVDINVLNENFDNIDKEFKKIDDSKGSNNGIATLDETGKIPQTQIGIMAGVDLLYSGGNEAPPTVTIMNIPTEYKYYELLIYGKGGYTAKNSLKINDLLIREVYTSSNEGFFMKAIITDKVYCSASANESYYDAVLPGDAMSNFKEGIFIGNKLNKITIDTTASTSGEIRYITLLGYK